jgi:hypothetical protein
LKVVTGEETEVEQEAPSHKILTCCVIEQQCVGHALDEASTALVKVAKGLLLCSSASSCSQLTRPHVSTFERSSKAMYIKLFVFVPVKSAQAVKSAAFAAGAGRMKGSNYAEVAFSTRGTGQFRPLEGANPHIGTQGELETVEEDKIEASCASWIDGRLDIAKFYCSDTSIAKQAIKAIRQ